MEPGYTNSRFWIGDFGLAILDWRFWIDDFGLTATSLARVLALFGNNKPTI
ncbi:MAG: hypothetical protein ACFE0J_03945 [Elainellaceae cyanobacterium]